MRRVGQSALALLLVAGLARVAGACSSTSETPASTTPPPGSTGGRPIGAGPDDAEPEPTPRPPVECKYGDLDAASCEVMHVSGDPPPSTGGAIAEGSYVLARSTTYHLDGGSPDAGHVTMYRSVLDVTGTEMHFTSEGATPGGPWNVDNSALYTYRGTYTVTGSTLKLKTVCRVAVAAFPSTFGFAAGDASLDLVVVDPAQGFGEYLEYRKR